MTDIIASIVEWFAIMTMSLVGIEYEPPRACPPAAPAEYREAVFSGSFEMVSSDALAANCTNTVDYRPHDIPLLVERERIYKS